MKESVEDLAVFGGPAQFSSIKPVGQLAVPELETYLESLQPSFEHGRLSSGVAVRQLESRLASFHNVEHCIAVANACIGLVMVLRSLAGAKSGSVVIPAFSYSGIPHVTQWASQTPRFCDVEELRHGLDPQAVFEAIDGETTAILAVCNVHGSCEIDGLCAVAGELGVPILFDSVSALGATYGGKTLGSFGRAEVFSLHATKMLNGFEGGYITTNDGDLAHELLAFRARARATLNEMHAVLAMASLEKLPDVMKRNETRYRAYEAGLERLTGLELLPYINERSERYTYQMALADVTERWPLTREETVRVLRAERAFAMSYYSPPLHRSSHCPPNVSVPHMPVSESLARRFMYLPVGEHTTVADAQSIVSLLGFVSEHGEEIAHRLRMAAV